MHILVKRFIQGGKKKIIRLIPRNNDLIGLDECNLRLNEPAKDEETKETEREMFPV